MVAKGKNLTLKLEDKVTGKYYVCCELVVVRPDIFILQFTETATFKIVKQCEIIIFSVNAFFTFCDRDRILETGLT